MYGTGIPWASTTEMNLGGAKCDASGYQMSTDVLMVSGAIGRAKLTSGELVPCCGD